MNFQKITKRGEGHSNSKNYITIFLYGGVNALPTIRNFFTTKIVPGGGGGAGQGLLGIFLNMHPFLITPGFPNRRHQLAITVAELTKSIAELLKLP